jgi:AmpD protein
MRLNRVTGWFEPIEKVESPNWDERPDEEAIDTVVVHGISLPPGQFGGRWIDDLFTNRLNPDAHPQFKQLAGLKVSAHVLIRRNGSCTQFVPVTKRAWHAGKSRFCGREHCNNFSVGIELEGADLVPYTNNQYLALTEICYRLMQAYPAIQKDRIVGHCDIAPERKTDPGPAFDWTRFFALLSNQLEAVV